MLFLYNIILHLSLLIISPFIIFKLLEDRSYRTGLSERLGIIPSTIQDALKDSRPIWFHAASVGEVIASQGLLKGIKEKWPEKKLLISTFTPTGKATAIEKINSDGVIFLPLDIPWVVKRVLKKINPSTLILMETEIWPNLIKNAGNKGIPVLTVNGRISDRSYGKYWFISPLLRNIFNNITWFLMQSDGDAGRIITLGAAPEKVEVTGNIKFDLSAVYRDIPFMNGWKGPVLMAGSTHSGEDGPLIDLYLELKEKYPDLKLFLAPRHLERIREVEGILNEKDVRYARRSGTKDSVGESVFILDTLGELSYFYRYGDVVFIGGSLVPKGGHNLMEPALYGRPVLFGPHTGNFRDAAQILMDSGGGTRVEDLDDMKKHVDILLSDSGRRCLMGENAKRAVLNNCGATERTLNALSRYII